MTEEGKVTLKERILAVLAQADKPLKFEQVYDLLAEDGHPLPSAKPKLVVRKVLYSHPDLKVDNGGTFRIKGEDEAAGTGESEIKMAAMRAKAAEKKDKKDAKPTMPPMPGMPKKSSKPAKTPASSAAKADSASAKPKRKTSERIITLLSKAEKPLTFDQIYELLAKDGYAMPKDKPKLVVRKALYRTEYFNVVDKSKYELQEGVEVPPEKEVKAETTAAPATPSEPATPVVSPDTSASPSATGGFSADDVAKAAREAAEAARGAAAEEAKKAIAEAVKEATKQAAEDAKRKAEADAERHRMIEEAKREAAEEIKQAAKEAAAEAAKEAKKAAEAAAAEVKLQAELEAARNEAKSAAIEEAKKAAVEEVRKAAADAVAPSQPATPPAATPPAEQVIAPTTKKMGSTSIKGRAIAIIEAAGKPLSFGEIYEKLSKDGHPLPPEKPKSVVSKVLYNKNAFIVSDDGLITPVQ